MPPSPIPSYSPDEWDALARRYATSGLENIVKQYTKHGLLGLSNEGVTILASVLHAVSRQSISAAAALSAQGMNLRPAILPHMLKDLTPEAPPEPPSPL